MYKDDKNEKIKRCNNWRRWNCEKRHSWKSAIYSRVAGSGCPICAKELQSSFPEKIIYYYVKKVFDDAVPNYKSEKLGLFELDVYIPSLKIAIEYDGERWHQNTEKDLDRNTKCTEALITLIRVREPKCPELLDNLSKNIFLTNKKKGMSEAIKKIFEEISKITNLQYELDVDISRDNAEIMALLNISEKENSLFHLQPDIASEWDWDKNGVLTPKDVTVGSDKKVWWLCPLRHSFFASISSRVRGRGCPVCSGKKILKGFNDFESKCPELAINWDYTKNNITPDMVAYGSDKKVWWNCDKGHSYICSINNRRSGQSCSICSNKQTLIGFNDLATTNPDIAEEWDYELNEIKPTEVTAGSHKKVWWKCSICGHRWISPIYNKTSGHGCPECAKQKRKKR